MSGTTASNATKRACDACHRRKVKCNGINPCQNCVQASLTCTFNKPPQKKGPKGSRAKVISELRKSQEVKTATFPLSDGTALNSPLASPLFARHGELLTPELVETCISQFFEKMYTTIPILHRSWIQQRAMEMQTSVESHCVVSSLCVYMIIQLGIQGPGALSPSSSQQSISNQQSVGQGVRLIEDIKRRRDRTDYVESPTTAAIVTSFFLSAGYFQLQKHNAAWYYLQEAITFAKIMRIHDEKSYQRRPSSPTDMMNRRLFWLLFVTERAQALHKHRDVSFHETIEFPKPEPEPLEDLGIIGLTCLYSLFRIVDGNVSEIWNNLRSENPVVWPHDTAVWLAQLQQQLTEAVPEDLKCTEIQEADVRITQQWLRTVVWQLSTASGCLSSTASDESMTLSYPIKIAKDLAAITSRLSLESMEAHGIGLVEKLFDITYALADVISLVPIDTGTFEVGPREHLSHFLDLISTLRYGEARFVRLLQEKIAENLPSMAASMGLQLPPQTSSRAQASAHDPVHPSMPPLPQVDGSESSASTPYESPSIISMQQQMTPTQVRFPALAPTQTSAIDTKDTVMSNIMGQGSDVTSPSSPNPEVSSSGSNGAGNPYSMRFQHGYSE